MFRMTTHLLTREVETHSTLSEKAGIKLVFVPRDTGNDDITQRHHILQCLAFQVVDLVSPLFDTFTSSELLDTSHIHTVDTGSIVCQQRRQRPTDNLRPVHYTDSVSEKTVAIGQNRIVDFEVLQDLDNGERCARENTFLSLSLWIEESDVLVHVEDVAMA